MSRRSGQERGATVTEPEQSTLISTQEISAETLEPLVPASDTYLEEQGQSSVLPELGEGALELGTSIPEPASARSPEPNTVASEPGPAKPELSEPVSELSVTNVE